MVDIGYKIVNPLLTLLTLVQLVVVLRQSVNVCRNHKSVRRKPILILIYLSLNANILVSAIDFGMVTIVTFSSADNFQTLYQVINILDTISFTLTRSGVLFRIAELVTTIHKWLSLFRAILWFIVVQFVIALGIFVFLTIDESDPVLSKVLILISNVVELIPRIALLFAMLLLFKVYFNVWLCTNQNILFAFLVYDGCITVFYMILHATIGWISLGPKLSIPIAPQLIENVLISYWLNQAITQSGLRSSVIQTSSTLLPNPWYNSPSRRTTAAIINFSYAH